MPTLEVTFTDPAAASLQIEVTSNSTVQVISDNKVEAAFSLDGVAGVSLQSGDIPTPAAPVVAAPVEPDPVAAVEPEPQPVDDAGEPIPTPPVTENDPTVTDTSAPVDPETVATDTADPHTTAVLSAIDTLDSAIATAGDVSNDETTVSAHVAQAQADIAELLTQYPDSPPLLDAKNQIDALAKNFTVPPAA